MVLEGYLSRFLVERFGRYVKGLDAENLRLSAWKGEILLKGLQLVPEALSEELDMPVDVKWGHVGLFHLSVPWSKLGSKPVRATLEDVYILVAPLDTWSMDDMERQRRARYQKSRGVEWRLRKHLERKASLMEGTSGAEGAGGGKGRWGRLLAKILDNVQITVKNIHIRYEDELSLEDVAAAVPRPLSAGITLRELVVQTVDKHWAPTYVQQDSGGGKGDESGSGFVYKLVSVDSLAVYCDEEVPPPPLRPPRAQSAASSTSGTSGRVSSSEGKSSQSTPPSSSSSPPPPFSRGDRGTAHPSSGGNEGGGICDRSFLAAGLTDEDLEGMFRTSLAEGGDRHSYVVIPASPFFRLRMQRDGGAGGGSGGGMGGSSKYKVQAFFNEVGLVLNNSQIANINKMRSTLRDLERWEALYRHRPKHKITDGPKAWWVYLVKCVSRPGKADKRAKLGWPDVARLLSLRKLYVRLYTARARHQATPEEYKQFTRLDEQLTANEIVAFRLKAIAELEEQEEAEALLLSSSSNLTVAAGQPALPRQTWGQWLLRRDPAPAAAAAPSTAAPGGDGSADGGVAATGLGAATQREDAAAQAEFLRAFSSPGEGGLEGDTDGADEHKQRVLFDVEASLNEGALTLVNDRQPCLRIIFDVKAELQKKKSDWRLELGLGALQAFGLAGQGARATTLLTRRTWKPPEASGAGGGDMIQIGDFQVWKSGGVIVDYQSEDPDRVVPGSSNSSTPAGPAGKTLLSPLDSPPGVVSGAHGVGAKADEVVSGSGTGGASSGDRGGSVVTVEVDFAPHQLMHSRTCVAQVTSMLATKDMRLLASAAQSKISRLQRATRSSFLHALGSSQRVEVTADIHAPLLVLPDDLQERSRSSLLVLDLGHIAFRRDDCMRGGNAGQTVEQSAGDSLFGLSSPVPGGRAEGGVPEPRVLANDPLLPIEQEDLAQNDWRLDITGVQVVVAEASSFLGAVSDGQTGSPAPLGADTAIVEGFDLNVKIRTTTAAATNGLVGARLEASLPRLSCNLHSSAYLLLTRLLKNELSRPAKIAATAKTTSSADDSSLSSPRAASQTPTTTTHKGAGGAVASPTVIALSCSDSGPGAATGASKEGEAQGGSAAMRMATSGRHGRGIKTVLSAELEPVPEIPGEDVLDDTDDVVGVGRGAPPRTPRRQSRSHRRRSSSSASSTTHASIIEESGSGGEGTVEERDGEGQDEERYEEESQPPAGLVVEVRVSAPLVCVLLVHDHSTEHHGRDVLDAGAGGGTGSPGAPAQRGLGAGTEGVVEGALVLAEICGLRMEYRGTIGAGGGGAGGSVRQRRSASEGMINNLLTAGVPDAGAAQRQGLDQETSRFSSTPEASDHDLFPEREADGMGSTCPYNFCLIAASFRVKDMHQRVTADPCFSYLLSSTDPSPPSTQPSLLPPVQDAVRVIYMPARTDSGEGSGGNGGDGDAQLESRTDVTLGGVWANWNPETVAALSIFAYGMYGISDGGAGTDSQGDSGGLEAPGNTDGRVGNERGMNKDERSSSRAHAVDDSASVSSAPGEAGAAVGEEATTCKGSGTADVDAGEAGGPELASVEAGTRRGVIVVAVGRVSLWLNKEVHGRRLALLEAEESTVEISKYHHPEGSVSKYSMALGAARLTDLGTKDSRWRSMIAPSRISGLPRQEVRLDLVQDSRRNVDFPLHVSLVLQSCAANYLNQTWLEVMDYVMNGVLGDGPWCPWLLVPEPKDGSSTVGNELLRPPPPVLKKKRICITANDTEVKLPAGHAGEDWATLGAKSLTACNSYESRQMGDSPAAKSELCQVWTVRLDGVDIRSSRCSSHPEATSGGGSDSGPSKTAPGTVPSTRREVDPDSPSRRGSTLLRGGGLSPGAVTLQAWWPVVPRVGAPESDGIVSNYVLVGRAPGLDLSLHKSDFSVLWQILGENVAGPVPEYADSLFALSSPGEEAVDAGNVGEARQKLTDAEAEAADAPAGSMRAASEEAGVVNGPGGNVRRQLVVFPYEHPSITATTFDITFHLPHVALVAHESRDLGPTTATPVYSADEGLGERGADIREGSGSFEVGKVRSTLLTWRMLRFSDFRSLNEVVMAEPLVTESPPGKRLGESWGGHRKLLSPGQVVPLSFHPHLPGTRCKVPQESGVPTGNAESSSAPSAAGAGLEGKGISTGIDGQGDSSLAGMTEGEDKSSAASSRARVVSGCDRGSSFLWKKMSWPDGGRTNSLAVSGASVLLSKVGWDRWRAWAVGATADAAVRGGDSNSRDSTGQPVEQPRVVVQQDLGENQALPKDLSASTAVAVATAEDRGAENVGSSETPSKSASDLEKEEAATAHDAGLIVDLAAALDISLSRTSFMLEPWQYGGGNGRGGGAGEEGYEGGSNGAVVVVRVDMSLTMTSAFFLDGRWAAQLGACGTNATSVSASALDVGNVNVTRHDDDSPRTTLLSCRLAKIEAFSRPSSSRVSDPDDMLRDHPYRLPRGGLAGGTQTARRHPSANTPQEQEPEGRPGVLGETEDVVTGGWRTILEPAAGTVTYAFSPRSSTAPAEKTVSAPDAAVDSTKRVPGSGCGFRRVSAEGWSAVRAVVRPYDVVSVARVLSPTKAAAAGGSEAPQSGRQAYEESGPSSSPLSVATPPRSPFAFADLSVLASGVGITVRLEDDSGTHFVSPPELRPRHPEEDTVPSVESSRHHMQGGEELEEPPLPLSPRQASLPWTPTTGVPWRASSGFARHPAGAAIGAIGVGGEVSMLMGGSATDSVLRRLRSASNMPAQPVVAVRIGEWSVKYDRVSCDGGGGESDDLGEQSDQRSGMGYHGGGRALTTSTRATVSISTVAVIDLLQRVPCHAVFRDLLVIPAPIYRQQLEQDSQTGEPRSPAVPVPTRQPTSPSWRKWMEKEDENHHDIPSGESSADRRDGTPPLSPSESSSIRPTLPSGAAGTPHPSQSPPIQVAGDEDRPSVLVSYRKVVSFGDGIAATFGDSVAGTPGGDPIGREGEGLKPTAAAASSTASGGERCRVRAAVDLEGPITANWNPRTFVALWAVRSALAQAATASTGEADRDVDRQAEASDLGGTGGGDEGGVDDGHQWVGTPAKVEPEASNQQQRRTSTSPVCSTEFRVTARRGLEMIFNKENEGRQLMAVSGASLDLTVEASSGGDVTDTSAVVWNGQVKDLQARDPRGSNLCYSALVGAPSVSSGKEGGHVSPVALNFRYAKERGEGDLTPLDTIPADFAPAKSPATEAPRSGESGVSGPWESSILSLSFSELRATYVQPLWLEVIDFMWEGVLGTAVWGGSAEHGTDGYSASDPKTSATAEAERDGGLRSSSQIHVTMAAPTVILPGSLTDPRHLALRPKSFRFSTWTGGVDDTVAPPQLHQCSPTGPVARHMSVEAPDCDIDFGLCSRGGPHASGEWQLHPLLQDPVNVRVTVKKEYPAAHTKDAESGGCDGNSGPTREGASASDEAGLQSSPSIGGMSLNVPAEDAEGAGGPPGRVADGGRGGVGRGGDEVEQEKAMEIRVKLPRLLCMSLTPDARAALAGCIGENVLAAGFHGEISENFPLVAAAPSNEDGVARDISYSSAAEAGNEADEIDAEREGRETTREREGAGHDEKMKATQGRGGVGFPAVPSSSTAVQRQQYPSPPSSSCGTAWESRGEGEAPPLACPLCADSFDELLARHECAWCGGTVCRKCMHTLAFTANDENTPTDSAPHGRTIESDIAPVICPSLVCDGCAARLFPETSLHPSGQVRFRYGDDGPVAALDVALEVPGIQVDFLPLGSTLPLRDEGKEQEQAVPLRGVIGDGREARRGSMSVLGNGLELTYKRSARRRGGVEAALGALSLVDISSGTVFSDIISPAPMPTTGETRPPQMVLSYHFSPTTEAQIQVMVNHLEAIVAPSAIRNLSSLAKPPPPPPAHRWKSGQGVDSSPVDAHSGLRIADQDGEPDSVEGDTPAMHDLAALQLAQDGDEDGAPKRPLTLKVTLLDPVLMLPQDDQDADSKALFLQGLVMANYVRSPRYEKAFQPQQQPVSLGVSGTGRKEAAAAEARDTSLQIIRLESQLGRMFGGSGRGPGGGGTGASTSLGGLGEGAGAIDPVTLSLHYSEVERPLHPMVKDLKCQVEEVVCQFTYQDISLFNAVLSGWSSKLISGRDATAAGDSAIAAAAAATAVTGDSSMLTLADTAAVAGAARAQDDADVGRRLESGLLHAKDATADTSAAASKAAIILEGAAALGFGDDEEEEEEDEEEEEELIQDGRFYDVVFETASLGIVLLRQDGVAVVEEVSAYKGVRGRAGGPFPGDELTEVAGVPTSCLSYDRVVDRIRSSPRPITLRFRRALFECWWGREYTLDLSSWDGHRLDGILLVGGGAGDQAVVGSADGYRPRRRVLTGVQPLRPRVGALVVSIAGIPVSHVNFSAVTSLLHELMAESSQAATAAQSRDGSRRGGGGVRKVSGGWSETTMPPPSASSGAHRAGPSRVRSAPGREDGGRRMYQRPRRQRHQLLADDYNSGSRRRRSRTGNVIRVVLREVDVHAWPPNWRHEVQCPGVRVTVIDDVEGRDMPLLRAEVGSLDMTHESGPGMARYKSSAGQRASPHTPLRGSAAASAGVRQDDDAIIIVPVSRTAAACDAQVDYYNATGGRWEPLLERVVAQGDREIVTRRPAPVLAESGAGIDLGGGVEADDGEAISDGWGQAQGETCSVVRLSCFEEDVKVNVTHAALDVVLRALRDYKTIGGGSSSKPGADDSVGTMTRSSGSPRLSPTASATNFAARDGGGREGVADRGIENLGVVAQQQQQKQQQQKQQQQRYSPFVLQNRTGLQLEFWAHQDKVDSVSRFGRKGTVVDGMSDQPFSTFKTADGQRRSGTRNRRHASWLMSLRLVPTSEDPPGGSGVVEVSDEVEGQQFLNLPLNEAGRSFLQCMLVMEGVGGLSSAEGDGGQQQPRRLSRCDAIWEVCLENGRHKVTLRSALEIVNNCGSWLEVRCSTESFAAGKVEGDQTKKEVVGAVAPGGRLPLPLRWSRAEDIRLRPLVRRNSKRETGGTVGDDSLLASSSSAERVEDAADSKQAGVLLVGEPEGGREGQAFESSDCSVLVPAARAGETELGVTMSVIPWVACNPCQPPTDYPDDDTITTTTTPAYKPLFLFLEGIDANDPTRGRDSAAPGGGGRNPSSTRLLSSRRKRRGREGSSGNWGSVVSSISRHRHRADNQQQRDPAPRPFPKVPRTTGKPMAALSLRPLEVVVYASLSFRNLLPVGMGWRVAGERGDPGARVAEGWLGPGEGVHVLEANCMAMTPSLSFKIAGFDWSPPRQVAAAELQRPTRGTGADGVGNNPGDESAGSEANEYVPGINLQSVPCRNMSNQTLYLSVEAASVRMNSVLVTVFAGFWVRNLSGLPLTLGEPVPRGLSALELHEERLAESARDKTRRHSPSPPRQSLWDVHPSAVQSDQHGMTEEVYELRLATKGEEMDDSYEIRWMTAQGISRPPYTQVRLPSKLWRWEDEWTIDFSGAVAPNAPGTAGGGWESCPRKLRGTSYSNSCFSSSRAFKLSEPVWRRRWVRRRVPCQPGPTLQRSSSMVAEELPPPGSSGTKGTSVIYQPAAGVFNHRNTTGVVSARESESFRAVAGGGGLCLRVDDSAWSRPLNIAVQGAGGPFQVPGGRWPGLKRPAQPVTDPAEMRRKLLQQRGRRSPTPGGQGGGKRGVWGEGEVGVYELAYDVRVAPAPWNRTRVITVASRYTVMNKCDCVLVVKQYGSNVAMELEPGESRPLHWADGSLEATLSVSVIPQAAGSTAATLMDWSGPVGIGNIGTFPICIRPMPGGAALPADSLASPPMSRGSSPLSSRGGSSSASTPLSSPVRGGEGGASVMPVVGANRVLGVEVNIGRYSDGGGGDDSDRPVSADGADGTGAGRGGQGFRSSAVQVIFQEEAWGMGDRFPTYRLENHTNSRMFYGQASVPGPGDALPPGRSCLFGWDQPCPAEERAQGVLNLSLVLAPEPLSSPEGKRQAKTLNIRGLGERTSLTTSRGRVEVVVEPDGPSKLVRMYNTKPFSIIPSPPRARVRPPQPVRSATERSRTSPPYSGGGVSISGPPRSSKRLVGREGKMSATNLGAAAVAAGSAPSSSMKRASTSPAPSTTERGGTAGLLGSPPSPSSRRRRNRQSRHRTPPPGFPPVEGAGGGGVDSASGSGPASSSQTSLRELHVFCRAVRVSIVDGDRGEVVLGSLERVSMSVAATDAEVEVKFKLGSLQIDSHLPGTSFPVLLQPVRPGYRGADNKCVRFTLVAATRVKNVTYIKLASLRMDEFDLRLDEGMVRWAQGLADRVMWDLAADRRADEMNDRWPLPPEAFCSSQAVQLGMAASRSHKPDGGSFGGGRSSPGMVVSHGRGEGTFASRYVYLEVFQVSSVKVRLSLQRAKDSFDNVYVGVKPGQMLLDLMMRMDSAHIKLKSLIVHNATTTRSRLMLTAREHYERELKQQAFMMLGSLEAFGNPVGLLRGMGQGMQDFVKEPVLGLLKSVEDLAPEELMHGMARGAGSLLNHSVGGVANSVSLITGTVSQNLTTLAMDKEYKLQRARRKDARGENKDVLDGIGSAGGSLARGLTDGVSGLIKNPLKGAESGGFAGFAKGVGTGMLGLVVKPVVGVTDAATDLLQGVRGTTASIAQIGKPSPSASSSYDHHHHHQQGGGGGHLSAASEQDHSSGVSGGIGSSAGRGGGWEDGVGQVRPRRVLYGPERALRPYAIEDARAAAFLRATRYKDEEYTAHLEIIETAAGTAGVGTVPKAPSRLMVLTRSLVLLLRVPGGEVTLEQRLDGIQAVEIKAEGVLLHLRSPSMPTAQRQGSTGYPGLPPPPSEEDDGLRGRNRSRAQARGIPCSDEALKRRLYDLLDAAVKNAARLL